MEQNPPGPGDTNRDRWAKFYAEGENKMGMRAITPNGVSSDRGDGFQQMNWDANHNGSVWEMPRPGFPQGVGISGTKGKVGSGMRSNRNLTGL